MEASVIYYICIDYMKRDDKMMMRKVNLKNDLEP